MANKIKKVIESEIQEIVLGRLSSLNAQAAKAITKVVRSSSKEIAKKFIKVLSKEKKKEAPLSSSLKAKVPPAKAKRKVLKTKTVSKKPVLVPRKGKK